MIYRIAALVLAVVVLGCGGAKKAETAPGAGAETATLRMSSPAFADGAAIPQKFSQFGEGVSPALEWTGAPEGTKAFALVCRDPDAPMGTFVHWVIYEIPDSAKGLTEGVPAEPMVQTGGIQGTNSARTFGYVGPRPPAGPAHRYIFTLYALDQQMGLGPGLSDQELMEQIRDRILDSAKVMGKFKRP
jgi:hypothetical protein